MLIKILFLSCVFINFYSDASNCCKDKKSDEQGSSSKSVSPKPPKPTGIRGDGKPISTSPVTYTQPVKPINNMFSTTSVPISSELGFPSLTGKVFSEISTENKVNHYSIVKTTNGRDSLSSVLIKIGINDFDTMNSLLNNGDIICFKDDNAINYDVLVIFFKKEKLEQQLINLSQITKINDCIYYCSAMTFSFCNDVFIGKLSSISGSTEEEQLQKFFKD